MPRHDDELKEKRKYSDDSLDTSNFRFSSPNKRKKLPSYRDESVLRTKKMASRKDDSPRASLHFRRSSSPVEKEVSQESTYQNPRTTFKLKQPRYGKKRKSINTPRESSNLSRSKKPHKTNYQDSSHYAYQQESASSSTSGNRKITPNLLEQIEMILKDNSHLLSQFELPYKDDQKYEYPNDSDWLTSVNDLFQEFYKLPHFNQPQHKNPSNVISWILKFLASKKNGLRTLPSAKCILEFLPYLLLSTATSTTDIPYAHFIIHRLGMLADNNPENLLVKELGLSAATQEAVLKLLDHLQKNPNSSITYIGTSVWGLGLIAKTKLLPLDQYQSFIQPLYQLATAVLEKLRPEEVNVQNISNTALALAYFAKIDQITAQDQEKFSELLKELIQELLNKIKFSPQHYDLKHLPQNIANTISALGHFVRNGLISPKNSEQFSDLLEELTQELLKILSSSQSPDPDGPNARNIANTISALRHFAEARFIKVPKNERFSTQLITLTQGILDKNKPSLLSSYDRMHVPNALNISHTVLALRDFARVDLITDPTHQEILSTQLIELTHALLEKGNRSLLQTALKYQLIARHIANAASALGYFAKAEIISSKQRETYSRLLEKLTDTLLDKRRKALFSRDPDPKQVPDAKSITSTASALGHFAKTGLIISPEQIEIFSMQLTELVKALLDKSTEFLSPKHRPDIRHFANTALALGYFAQAELINNLQQQEVFSNQLIKLTQAFLDKSQTSSSSQSHNPQYIASATNIANTASALGYFAKARLINPKQREIFNRQLKELTQMLLHKNKTSLPYSDYPGAPNAQNIANTVLALGYFAKTGLIISPQERETFRKQLTELTEVLLSKSNTSFSQKNDPNHSPNTLQLSNNALALGYFAKAGIIDAEQREHFTAQLIQLTQALVAESKTSVSQGSNLKNAPTPAQNVSNGALALGYFVQARVIPRDKQAFTRQLLQLTQALHRQLPSAVLGGSEVLNTPYTQNITHIFWSYGQFAKARLLKEEQSQLVTELKKLLPMLASPHFTSQEQRTLLEAITELTSAYPIFRELFSQSSQWQGLLNCPAKTSVNKARKAHFLLRLGQQNLLPPDFFDNLPTPPVKAKESLTTTRTEQTFTTSTSVTPTLTTTELTIPPPSISEFKNKEIVKDISSTSPILSDDLSSSPPSIQSPITTIPVTLSVVESKSETITEAISSSPIITDTSLLSLPIAITEIPIPESTDSLSKEIREEKKEEPSLNEVTSTLPITQPTAPPFSKQHWTIIIGILRGLGECEDNCAALAMALVRYAESGELPTVADRKILNDGFRPIDSVMKSILLEPEELVGTNRKSTARNSAPAQELSGQVNTQFELTLAQGVIKAVGTLVYYKNLAQELQSQANKQAGYVIGLLDFSRCTISAQSRYMTRRVIQERKDKIEPGHLMAFQYNSDPPSGEEPLMLFEPEALKGGKIIEGMEIILSALPKEWFQRRGDPFYYDVSYVIIDSPALRRGLDPEKRPSKNKKKPSTMTKPVQEISDEKDQTMFLEPQNKSANNINAIYDRYIIKDSKTLSPPKSDIKNASPPKKKPVKKLAKKQLPKNKPTIDKNLTHKPAEQKFNLHKSTPLKSLSSREEPKIQSGESESFLPCKPDSQDPCGSNSISSSYQPLSIILPSSRSRENTLPPWLESKSDNKSLSTDKPVIKPTEPHLLPSKPQEIHIKRAKHTLELSVILALLLPRIKNNENFNAMYVKLFGANPTISADDAQKFIRYSWISWQNKNVDNIPIINQLLTTLRDRVNEEVTRNKNLSGARVLSRMAEVNIEINYTNQPKKNYSHPNSQETIYLAEKNGQHYFSIPTNLYNDLIRIQRPEDLTTAPKPSPNLGKTLGRSLTQAISPQPGLRSPNSEGETPARFSFYQPP